MNWAGIWTQNNKTNYFICWAQLSYIYTFLLSASHRQAAYENREIQNFTAATDSQVWYLTLVTVIRYINYTEYKNVLKNYNHKTFIYSVHVKMATWGL
jgi:hypothetical protein